MKRIRLTKNEFHLLKSAAKLPNRLIESVLKFSEQIPDGYVIHLSEEDASDIRDICGEQLQVVGFDENYSLSKEGKNLESLIDKLFTG